MQIGLKKFCLKNMFKNAGHEYENAILAHNNEQVLSSRYQPSINKHCIDISPA